MSFWKRLIGDQEAEVDFYEEGLAMLNAGNYHEALTSLRLALRDAPEDAAVLQQIAIAQTRIGMTDEAVRTYRKVLSLDGESAGAHYGLAFIMIHDGKPGQAVAHLRSFLANPPPGPEAQRHIVHAQKTLSELEASTSPSPDG
ncbi:MAG: tetratricopeptide repeat protein [Longimicrobiales bacterium]